MSLQPLSMKTKLAPNPTSPLKYAVTVKNNDGSEISLADPKVTRGLVALMNQHATIGGAACHWGGPAAYAEVMSSLHAIMFKDAKTQWFDAYNFVNDAGHAENGIYALRANYGHDNLNFDDLRGFRSIESKLTGHGESHLNPEGVFLSNGPLGSAVPQAQGLAMADKLIGNNRTTICVLSDGASMEGEAKETFASLPGLAAKGKINPTVFIISDNNTKLSGRIDQDSFSMAGSFESMKVLGWDVLVEENGNDLQAVHNTVETALEKAKSDPTKPICLILKTVKGIGVKATEEAASGGHGYPLKAYDEKLPSFLDEIFENNTPEEFKKWASDILASKPEAGKKSDSSVKMEKVQPGFARASIKAAKEGLPVFSLTSDLQGSTGIKAFHAEFPDRYIDMGIAESNMISSAIGLSKQGLIPVVDTFAQFGVTKGNLPLTMANLSEGPFIALFSHTGFQDAADGASHQATTYMAAVSSIPHTTVINCTCSSEAEAYMYQAIKSFEDKRAKGEAPDSVIFFFGRENHPEYYVKDDKYEWGKAQVISEGSDVTIVATGPLLGKAIDAAKKLKEQGVSATIINNAFINKPDVKTISAALNKTNGKLITIEDHQLIGGMGAQLVHALKSNDVKFSARTLANDGKFGQSAYKASHLYDIHKLNVDGIVEAYKQLNS